MDIWTITFGLPCMWLDFWYRRFRDYAGFKDPHSSESWQTFGQFIAVFFYVFMFFFNLPGIIWVACLRDRDEFENFCDRNLPSWIIPDLPEIWVRSESEPARVSSVPSDLEEVDWLREGF